ncbi:MAG: YkgJ family cysteine cluster protein [Pseudomonadota bacterium]
MGIIQRDGFDFSFDPSGCEGCPGYCCCGESGNVWVSQNEILQICSFLQTNIVDYIRTYLNRIGNRFSIKERFTEQGFECVFFECSKKQCSIYPVRPLQCRQYPFWEHFKEHKDQVIKECPGIIAKRQGPCRTGA